MGTSHGMQMGPSGFGLTHGTSGDSKPLHEYRPAVRDTSHGYSVQSAIQQSSGGPEDIPSYVGTTMAGSATGESPEQLRQPAGYDLQGIGGAPIKDVAGTAPPTMGRVTREDTPLYSHDGYDQRGSDYDHKDQGFRFRNKEAT